MSSSRRLGWFFLCALALLTSGGACKEGSGKEGGGKEGAGKGEGSAKAPSPKKARPGFVSEKPQVLMDFAADKEAAPLKWDAGDKTVTFKVQSFKNGVNVIHSVIDGKEKEIADCSVYNSSGNVGRAELMLRPSPDPRVREVLHVLCVLEGDKPTTRGSSYHVKQDSKEFELSMNDMYTKEGLYYEPIEKDNDGLYLQALNSQGDLTCGIRKDGKAVCWGRSLGGEDKPPQDVTFTMIDHNIGGYCGITTEKKIACWGDDASINRKSIEIPEGTYADIAVGHSQMCATDTAGKSRCWWLNPPKKRSKDNAVDILLDHGLEQGSIDPPEGEFVNIEAEYSITCGLLKEGTIKCWGHSLDGMISDVPKGTFSAIALSTNNGCGLAKDGGLICWGSHAADGRFTAQKGPYSQMDVSNSAVCAIGEDSKIQCWGYSEAKMLEVPEGEFRQLSVGDRFGCAIRLDDTVACWGTAGSSDPNPKETSPPLY